MGSWPYTVLLHTPLPEGKRSDPITVDPNVTAMRTTSTLPGGWNGCTIGLRWDDQPLRAAGLANPITVRGLGHVQVFKRSDRGPRVWEGRILKFNRPGGREVTGFVAQGYGIHAAKDLWFHSTDTTNTISGGQLVQEAITNSAPVLRLPGFPDFNDPLGQFTRAEQNGRYPSQIIDQVVKAGSDIDLPMLYTVYEDRYVRLLPLACPTDAFGKPEADYHVPLDSEPWLVWNEDYENIVGGVEVAFTPPGGGEQVTPVLTDPNFAPTYGGLMRAAHIVQSSMQLDEALKFRNRHLALYSKPVITVDIVRDDAHPLLNRFGAPVEFDVCRAGQWVQVSNEAPLPIITCDMNVSSNGQGTLTLQLSSVGGL